MKKFVIVVFFVGFFCFVVRADDLKSIVVDGMMRFGGEQLDTRSTYSLWGTMVIQKLDKGYLLVNGGPQGDGMDSEDNPMDPVFLYTDKDLPESYIFRPTQLATYVGEYEYQSINGFNRKIHAFRLSDKEAVISGGLPKEDMEWLENQETIASCARNFITKQLGENCVSHSLYVAKYGDSLFSRFFSKPKKFPVCIEEPQFCSQPTVSEISAGRWSVSSCVEGKDGTLANQVKAIRKYFTVDFTIPPHDSATLNSLEFMDDAK